MEVYLYRLLLSEQALKNLVNKSVMRVTKMYQQLESRLKSTAEKEQFQKKMAHNQDKTEDAPRILRSC